MPAEHRKLILASSLAATFEWYGFYLYGVLAPVFALLFGRLGDLIGRKYTFLVTLLLMGAATFAIGVLPGHASIGVAAPIGLVLLRLLQGLAIGGEYGGVVTCSS